MNYDGYIFDIDGVLLDTSRSFSSAVLEAVTFATNSDRFTFDEISRLKSVRGFNNDWHVAIAGAAWLEYKSSAMFDSFAARIEQYGGGLSGLRKLVPELTPELEQWLTRLTQEAYGGTSTCRKLYEFDPQYLRIPGWWRTETATVSLQQIEPIRKITGIVTGRAQAEAALAFELLGWDLPVDAVAISDDPDLDKPNPQKLSSVIGYLGCQKPVYVGDARDDLELVKNYRQSTGLPLDFFLIKSQNKILDYDRCFESVPEMLTQIGINHD